MTTAAALVAADLALRHAVGAWQGRGGVPAAVTRPAWQEQQIERRLARDRRLRRVVVAQLPGPLARDVADDVTAYADLEAIAKHVPARPLSAFRVFRPRPPLELESYYREAERRSGVPWQALAAINFVETDFGRIDSRAGGGQGPMQFIPSTWRRYGRGDRHDPRQAILAAGRLLAAAGAARDLRAALRHYNPYPTYGDAIIRLAGRIRRDPSVFLEYYARRLVVRTPQGYRRLSSVPAALAEPLLLAGEREPSQQLVRARVTRPDLRHGAASEAGHVTAPTGRCGRTHAAPRSSRRRLCNSA